MDSSVKLGQLSDGELRGSLPLCWLAVRDEPPLYVMCRVLLGAAAHLRPSGRRLQTEIQIPLLQ